FFFQAEDGIRDFHVTGVQTCALPILQDAYARFLAIIPTTNNTMMAPTTEPIQPAGSPGAYQPSDWPRNPATTAPMMPRMVVMMMPMFWSPGMMARAISPTTKPTMIIMMMLIRVLLFQV